MSCSAKTSAQHAPAGGTCRAFVEQWGLRSKLCTSFPSCGIDMLSNTCFYMQELWLRPAGTRMLDALLFRTSLPMGPMWRRHPLLHLVNSH